MVGEINSEAVACAAALSLAATHGLGAASDDDDALQLPPAAGASGSNQRTVVHEECVVVHVDQLGLPNFILRHEVKIAVPRRCASSATREHFAEVVDKGQQLVLSERVKLAEEP